MSGQENIDKETNIDESGMFHQAIITFKKRWTAMLLNNILNNFSNTPNNLSNHPPGIARPMVMVQTTSWVEK